ncbi:uncharacterized protein OCT59_019157 [Rhizophagus irregularis]|uniref:F-box domain-containing protein n=2 Tax=Rhizophagus irregularis TaxID=588596 RepID=A0A015KK69_RHIIW|nr:hypothetical protein GLOIN_2v1767505 [Rhizophagus irregularis DAOM 181602=DAOM 197198]EXX60091.1 hypothetical protein RirG_183100 [Rhizophagus irregularis DAOM 197198w]POG77672.1 hypothetical protein GLOIN_2v1767505 [Rhizophagus irregularis DAOM 181602=DAOM 197198]UZO26947.1 hypothetical protein OCT59_019157 [Rhizophagus irregularis]GET62466.1 hypothetical protein GLOIN_2v1767505 [Rhizophagus irregularis DAOM 181602=DAOM 197198]|eukprot:XP_025184538.1 hypothetical protein GLOIN_2v1767505 [Rhizophagus irregularis DAOM 181602=DAOM 197198]
MSCSKIFSGDLPELTYEVIKYFQNDYSTLYSCILVNRLWCRLAIPLLWENPFSILTKNYNFIEIYLHNLNDDLKTKLNEFKIIDNSLPSNTLFNYPKFLKYLNTHNFIFFVEKWLKYYSRSYNRLGDVYVLLLTIFIENEVNLHTLEIEISCDYYNSFFDKILESILQSTNFIHSIINLKLYINNYNENTVRNRILPLIHSHQNLKKIMIGDYYLSLYQSLLLLKEYNCSNTLNTITFYGTNFKDIINLDKVFEQLNVLESVHIFHCSSLNTSFTQQIINLTKPFKLKSLFISEISQIESFQLLLQKSGDYLENVGFSSNFNLSLVLKQQLVELFIKYCKNIKFLDFCGFGSQILTYQVLNLIENIKQNLNYLTIYIWYDNTAETECSSIVLQNLGQILPSKLEYLCLCLLHIKANDFEIFLKNSKDTFIKKLLICNNEGQDILPCIKKYIMKKKRAKYLAIYSSFDKIKELFSLKDEVKEFELYNIKVQSYESSEICISDFIN